MKREVDKPDHKLSDYPPQIVIDLISTERASAPAVLNVIGLKDDCSFTFAVSSESYSLALIQLQTFIFILLDRLVEVDTQPLQVIISISTV